MLTAIAELGTESVTPSGLVLDRDTVKPWSNSKESSSIMVTDAQAVLPTTPPEANVTVSGSDTEKS